MGLRESGTVGDPETATRIKTHHLVKAILYRP
jgi:hypothetical protein